MSRPCKRYRYVDEEGAENIKKYQYAGADLSYVYIYLLTPMNKFLVEFIPMWMAPNLLTLIGWCFTISSYLITLHYSPDFQSELPRWVCAYAGVAMFCYQTIDNLDGKQARRTNSSSPLGLLFDHGIDAANTTIGALMLASMYQFESLWFVFTMWGLAIVPFVFATWEEYHTGSLILGRINGPTDGVLLNVINCFVGAYNPQFWRVATWGTVLPAVFQGTVVENLKMSHFIIYGGIVSVALTCLANANTVYKHVGGLKQMGRPVARLFPFAMTAALTAAWALYSPTDVFHRHPRVFMFGVGFLFCNLICKLMLAHLCHQEYKVLRTVMIPLFLAVGLVFADAPGQLPGFALNINEDAVLFTTAAWACGTWLHFVFHVIPELTGILGIRCFTIPYNTKEE